MAGGILPEEFLTAMLHEYQQYRGWNRTHCIELECILTHHSLLLDMYQQLRGRCLSLEQQIIEFHGAIDGLNELLVNHHGLHRENEDLKRSIQCLTFTIDE